MKCQCRIGVLKPRAGHCPAQPHRLTVQFREATGRIPSQQSSLLALLLQGQLLKDEWSGEEAGLG